MPATIEVYDYAADARCALVLSREREEVARLLGGVPFGSEIEEVTLVASRLRRGRGVANDQPF